MSPPVRNPTSHKDGAPGTARWLNMVTTMVLGAAALILGVVAVPSLLRAAAGTPSDAQDFAPPVRAQNPTVVPGDHPGSHLFAVPDDDGDSGDEADPSPARRPATLPLNDPRSRPPRFPGDRSGQQIDDDDGPQGLDDLGLKTGVMKKPLALRDRRTNAVIRELAAGDKVHILREEGDWVLVVKGDMLKGTADDVVTGWAKRSELLLR